MSYSGLPGYQKRRLFRFGALAVVIVAGIVFHQKGGSYAVVRILYFAVVLGLFFTRTRYGARQRPGQFGGGLWGLGARRPQPQQQQPQGDPPPRPFAAPGWVRDAVDPTIERYWDGSAWTRHRRWNGKEWIEGG